MGARVKDENRKLETGTGDRTIFGIYIHIPFCRTRCPYCDFLSNAIPGGVPADFVRALCDEIRRFDGPSDAATVFFGGGTPSLLAPDDLGAILEAVRERFALDDPEISIEANPDDVAVALAQAWRELGVNRVSLGVQSFDDATLEYLGRRHNAAAARRACEIIRDHFENWGMDLIFGAPPLDAWRTTLQQCAAFAPAHVSAYGLTYEKGTRFESRAQDGVDDDTWLALYREAESMLDGWVHYEISNYARPGLESRHNLLYWRNEEYAGFGPGAYSFLGNVRARNEPDLEAWLAEPGRKAESLSLTGLEVRLETVIQHLRLRAGLATIEYRRRFDLEVRDDFGKAIDALIDRGLVLEEADRLRPTAKGFELNNVIGLALVGNR